MSNEKLKKTVLTKNYDLATCGIFRVIRLASFARIIPVGNFSGGPGGRCLLVLFVLHKFGGPLYWLNARYGDKLRSVKNCFKKG